MSDGFGHERPGSGFTNDWYTPPKLLEILGPFDLDPCAGPVASVWSTSIDSNGKKSIVIYPFRSNGEAEGFLYEWNSRVMPMSLGAPTYKLYERPWPTADRMIALPDDGLSVEWRGRVFCNPPYSSHVGKWANKLAMHGNGILLIFARTETAQWKPIWETGDALLFPEGRMCFYLPSGERAKSGTAPSVLIAYGQENVECLRQCGIAGALVTKAQMLNGIKVSTL